MGNFSLIDGFSGAGGLMLGLKEAGFEPIYSFDNDPNSIRTQQLNSHYFKHPAVCSDINDVLSEDLFSKLKINRGELLLLAGGPPCQGFSIQRIGEDHDDRNILIRKYIELVDMLYPKFFLMENVPGILGKRGKATFENILKRTQKIGYEGYYKIVDAQDYGVPQRRKRLILVGIRKDIGSMPFDFPQPIKTKISVRKVIEYLPPPPLDGTDHPDFPLHRRDRLTPLNISRLQALKEGQGRDSLPTTLLAKCHNRSSNDIGHRNVYGRMAWDEVAPTITARFDSFTRGQFGHPDQLRSISLREGSLLQTFPEDFIFFGSKVEIARQIGNAVPPKLAYIIGKSIIDYYLNLSSQRL